MRFINLNEKYKSGMNEFLMFHKMEKLPFEIRISQSKDDSVTIKRNGNEIDVIIGRDYQIFRAVTLIKQNIDDEAYEYSERCFFNTGGAMFDGSQASSLMNVETVKKMLLMSAGMGFNMMMLYCEDSYDIEGEPYFGNMRPRYSAAELKSLDDYADSLGIELIPCIQVLGHLTDVINKAHYKPLSDQPSVLMVGDDRVYDLIDKMLLTMSKCFRSRRIHLGLDEAFGLGCGNYLQKNGYKDRTSIMTIHLKRVKELADKYGFKPMMWCDMFFSAKSKTSSYFDPEVEFDEKDRKAVPSEMSLVYWDYYHTDVKHYECYFDKIKYLSDNVIFAGCARNVRTFGCHFKKGKLTTDAAMTACKNKGIKEFVATVWGDDHKESSNYAILTQLQIFAEHMYSKVPDEEYTKKRFKACTGFDFDDMLDIDAFDAIPGYTDENIGNNPASKGLLWQNILMGLFDEGIENVDFYSHYNGLKTKLEKSAERYPEIKYLFDFYAQLANVLKDKADIGLRITKAYKSNDLNTLKDYAEEKLPQLAENIKKLREAHREYYYKEYKPIGWEILDIRYGSIILGADTAIKRIEDFIDKKIDKIDELEEQRLMFDENFEFIPTYINFERICSASRI